MKKVLIFNKQQMKLMKQLIASLFLFMICLLTQVAWGQVRTIGTYAANGLTWKYRIENNKTWIDGTTDFSSGPLNIPGTVIHNGVSHTVVGIGSAAFSYYKNVTSVSIPASVEVIGFHSFSHSDITSIVLPAGLTIIDEAAFEYCENLTHVDYSAATNLTEIRNFAFEGTAIPEAIFPASLTTLGCDAFAFCNNITHVSIPSSITNWIKRSRVPGVHYIENGAFHNCQGLTSATLPANMTSVPGGLFAQCKNLHHCNLNATLTSIGDAAFEECENLTEDLTPLTHVTYFGESSFYKCKNLSGHLTFPEGTQTIGAGAFCECTGLAGTLTFPESLKTIGGRAFAGCTGFTGTLTFPNNTESIGDFAFWHCTGLQGDLTLGENIKKVGERAFEDAGFAGGVLHIGMQNNAGVSLGDDALRGTGFSQVVVEGERPVAIGNAFYSVHGNPEAWDLINSDNKYQIALTIASGVRELPKSAFNGLYVTGNVNIPSTVTSIGEAAFGWCRKLTGVSLPATLTEIPDGCFAISSITSISFPNTITKVGDGAFQYCTKLTGLSLASSNITFIGDEAFRDCSNLVADAATLLPSTITTLGSGVFVNCRKITGEAVLPSPYQDTHPESSSRVVVNPMVGTGCYGIKMGPFANFFQPAQSFNQNTNWQGDSYQTLLYIDARECTVALTNSKNLPNTCYKFSRDPNLYDEDLTYCNFGNLAMNALVYLPSESVFQNAALPQKTFAERFEFNTDFPTSWQANGENFIMDGKCQRFYVQDGFNYRVPYAFTAIEARCSRTFSNTTGKAVSTLYLPYPTDLPDGMTAYALTFKGLDADGNKAFHFDPLPAGTRLEANHPYLVQITDGQSHQLPVMHNVQVPVTPDIETSSVMATTDADWKFYGTTERIDNAQAYDKKAYYLNGNKWWAVQNGVQNDFIAPFRSFIVSPTGAVPAKSFLMVLHDGTATDINRLEKAAEADIRSGRYEFYSVDGLRMGRDYNQLKSGQIYIVNGKKFYKL